ncbi:MAG: PilZ domain-containing protein [Spirochaetaceae bacterium]|jgi:c-di-GMP-binding flagellar brake protein YcgR|nr:PilZ domain-containing protein [Spirochaetaceae bacterium]
MFVTILVILIIVAGIAGLLLSQSKKDNKKSWVKFFAKGKDAGFSLGEIELLRRLAVRSSLDDPSSLFWSQHELDNCIRKIVRSARLSGGGDQSTHDFLSKLYDYRKKIEMDKPRIKKGIQDTRQIEEGQSLRLLLDGQGVFGSKILKNTGQYLTIVRPNNSKLPLSFSWTGTVISVYFWREDDAGYVFDTEVQDEVFSKGKPSLKINHATNLSRTQKRRSVRIKTHRAAFLYILGHDEPSNSIEMKPGLKCFIENLSDTGCGVLIGGKAASGMGIKVQFILNNTPVCISGIVRSTEYNEEKNQSFLHVEADTMDTETRNHVLGEVFGMLPEEDDLPFRVLDEEADVEAAANEITADTSATQDNAI